MKKLNLVGKIFGNLEVLKEFPIKGRIQWVCKCLLCGKEEVRTGYGFNKNTNKGCINCSLKKHGYTKTKIYASWFQMKERCNNPKSIGYKNYGARGIKVCERWLSFSNFLSDMGQKPSSNFSLDRINNNGNYEPNNCKWSTQMEQCNNMRKNRLINIDGKINTFSNWCKFYKIKYATAFARIKRGMEIKTAFTKEVATRRRKGSDQQ
jgi:hypothetical protein